MVLGISVSLVGFSSTTSSGSLSCAETLAAPIKRCTQRMFFEKEMKYPSMKEIRNFDIIMVHLETWSLLSFLYL